MKKLGKVNCNHLKLGTNGDCKANLIACASCRHREFFMTKENFEFCNHMLSNLNVFKCFKKLEFDSKLKTVEDILTPT